MTDEKKEPAKQDEQELSKAAQERLDEMYRTGVVPSGYAFNVEDGLHRPAKKGK